MALFNLNPSAIGSQIAATAAGKAAQAIAQSMSPKLVQDVQRVLKIGNVVGNTLGIKTGIGVLDNLFSLNGGSTDTPTPLLGGLTLTQAKAIYEQVKSARVSKKNLFFLRITDPNPPIGVYSTRDPNSEAQEAGGLFSSVIGAAVGGITSSIAGTVGAIAGSAAGSYAGKLASSAIGGVLGGTGGSASPNGVGTIAVASFDMLAMDVSYGASIVSDHVQIGSGFIDRVTGRSPSEMSITTMDDEAGSIKRWYNGKIEQIAHHDGTFGLPAEYLVDIQVVHAIPSELVPGYKFAYSKTVRLRPQSIQLELSRRDQAVEELQLQFSQFDSFF